MSTLGENIRVLRAARDIYQTELARTVGISEPHMCEIEKDRANPSINTIRKIAAALNVPDTWIVESHDWKWDLTPRSSGTGTLETQ